MWNGVDLGRGSRTNIAEIFIMPRPLRSELFLPHEVSVCHVVQRCVRRMFLAGLDDETGNDYTYRREWIRQRFEKLASVFAIDVLTYAILSNHS
jgi:hypothetical protein